MQQFRMYLDTHLPLKFDKGLGKSFSQKVHIVAFYIARTTLN